MPRYSIDAFTNSFNVFLEDLKRASEQYIQNFGRTDEFDSMQIDEDKRDFLDRVLSGRSFDDEEVEKYLYSFLNSWGCRAETKQAKNMAKILKEYGPLLLALPDDLELLEENHFVLIKHVYDQITSVHRISATACSKTLAVLRPKVFVMWDNDIADEYVEKRNADGYIEFMIIMRNIARGVRGLYVNSDLSLEDYLSPPNSREWQPTLAKILDEWNWVRITQKIRK